MWWGGDCWCGDFYVLGFIDRLVSIWCVSWCCWFLWYWMCSIWWSSWVLWCCWSWWWWVVCWLGFGCWLGLVFVGCLVCWFGCFLWFCFLYWLLDGCLIDWCLCCFWRWCWFLLDCCYWLCSFWVLVRMCCEWWWSWFWLVLLCWLVVVGWWGLICFWCCRLMWWFCCWSWWCCLMCELLMRRWCWLWWEGMELCCVWGFLYLIILNKVWYLKVWDEFKIMNSVFWFELWLLCNDFVMW